MALPPPLAAALDEVASRLPPRDLAAAAQSLSTRYRERQGAYLRGADDVIAYAVFRLPATYAAAVSALEAVRAAQPDLAPRSLLDLGAGPGTAAWAALTVWPEIEHITLLERDRHMISLGRELAAGGPAALAGAGRRTLDVTGDWEAEKADLVVAAYMLGEITPAGRSDFLDRTWRHTLQTGVIIEPGTPHGWEVIRDAQAALVAEDAHIVAPVPAGWDCLAAPGDWLHFAARVPRTRLHRAIKGADLAYEDEKFSYVAASRLPAVPIAARVIRRPQIRSGHVRLTVCTPEGVRELVITRANRDAFRRARDLRWGEAIPVDEARNFGLLS